MHKHCVLVITEDSVISFALANVVNASHHELMVIGSKAQNFDELIREINTFSADVIVLEKGCSFAGESSLTKLLMLYPSLLLVIASEEDNWLRVYRRKDFLMTSPADLISVIQSA